MIITNTEIEKSMYLMSILLLTKLQKRLGLQTQSRPTKDK